MDVENISLAMPVRLEVNLIAVGIIEYTVLESHYLLQYWGPESCQFYDAFYEANICLQGYLPSLD